MITVNIPSNFEYRVNSESYQKFYDKIITNIGQETENLLFKKDYLDNKHESNDGTHKYCMLCGSLIEDSYENKGELRSLVGENPKKCSHCVEEILMSYFQSRVLAPYTNKSHLLSDFEDRSVAGFYLNILNDNGVINKGHKFQFIKPLKDQSIFFEEIPEFLQLETLVEEDNINYSNIAKVISGLDKLTITGSFELLDGYKFRLSQNNLTEDDGWIIRDMIIDLIKLGHVSNIKQVSKKLKKLITNFDNLSGIDLVMYEMNTCYELVLDPVESDSISSAADDLECLLSSESNIKEVVSQYGK